MSNPMPTPAELTIQLHQLMATEIRPMQHAREIKALLDQGADASAADDQGLSPLLRCLGWTLDDETPPGDAQNMHEILSMLLAAGADLQARTAEGQSATDLAALWGDKGVAVSKLECEAQRRADPVLAALIPYIDYRWPKPDQPVTEKLKGDFLTDCLAGDTGAVLYHLHYYPQAVSWTDDTGNTALHYAINSAAHGNLDHIAPLVMAGADENALNKEGESPRSLSAPNLDLIALLQTAIDVRRIMRDEAARVAALAHADQLQSLNAQLLADPQRKKFRLRS